MVSASLRKYGMAMGQRPMQVFCASFMCFLLCWLGWIRGVRDGVLHQGNEEELFAEDSENLDFWNENHGRNHPWMENAMLLVSVDKEEQGKNVITKTHLEDMLAVYKKWYNITVEVNGKVFTTMDLCARGLFPDSPGLPLMPCFTLSPMHCFKEEGDVHDKSFKELPEAFFKFIFGQDAVPYSQRPSFMELNDREILKESYKMQKTGIIGCSSHMPAFTFAFDMMTGGVRLGTTNATTELLGAAASIWYLLYDAPMRTQIRLNKTKPELVNHLPDIQEAVTKHEKVYVETVRAHVFNSIEAVVLANHTWEDLKEEWSRVPFALYLVGGILMHTYMFFALVDFTHPLTSRVAIGLIGFCLVGFSQIAALGFYLGIGLKLNAISLAGLPVIALGLGVDDMFVLVRYFSELGVDVLMMESEEEIMGRTLSSAGPGVLLTSTCNVIAFACGAFLPIKAISDFCIGACVITAFNCLMMLTLFAPLLVLETRRIQRGGADPHPLIYHWHRYVLSKHAANPQARTSTFATSTHGHTRSIEKKLFHFLSSSYAPFMVNPIVRTMFTVLICGLIVLAGFSVANKTVGFVYTDMARPGSDSHRTLDLCFAYATSFPTLLAFKNLDVPSHQKEMFELYEALVGLERTSFGMVPPFLTMYAKYLSQVEMQMDEGWKHPVFAPNGLASSDPELFYPTFHNWGMVPPDINMQTLQKPGGDGFMMADMTFFNRFKFVDGGRQSELKLSFMDFTLIGLDSQDKIIDTVMQVKDVIEASPLKDNAFAYGPVFTFYDVFLNLESTLARLLIMNLAVIFVSTAAILRSLVAAMGVTLACGVIIFEIYGLAMIFIEFNIFSAGNLLMTMGVTVEFTAHLVCSFVMTEGDVRNRLSVSMCHIFPALIEGGASTFIAGLAMAFHPLPFIRKYFFGFVTMVVAVGLLNGMVFLPALLAFLDGFFNRYSYKTKADRQEIARRSVADTAYGARMEQSEKPMANENTKVNEEADANVPEPDFCEAPSAEDPDCDGNKGGWVSYI